MWGLVWHPIVWGITLASPGADQGVSGSTESPPVQEEIQDLRRRLEILEARDRDEVDLSDDRVGEVDGDLAEPSHPLAKPWFQNFTISGFAAAGFLATGNDGERENGGFLVKEATLWIEADVWEDISFFAEIQTNRLGKDDSLFVRTGEVHAHFRNVLKRWGDDLLGIKIGRIDIPFGEEYLWQDSSDNPLITQSAPYPYGFDEGILLYGNLHGLGWLFSVTDGTDDRSLEDNTDKAVNVKVYGRPWSPLYLSASFMRNGRAVKSAFEFGGSHFQPIGASHVSSVGDSASTKVEAYLYQLDAKYHFGDKAYVAFSFGQALVDDRDSTFDRDLLWFVVEVLYHFHPKVYGVARYSEIGTYKTSEGYHFDGKITAGGNAAFGYDARRLQRLSLGAGWRPNPRVLLKGEVGADWFDEIEGSPFTASGDERWLVGFEVVLAF